MNFKRSPYIYAFYILYLLFSITHSYAKDLHEVKVNEDDLLLFSAKLNKFNLSQNIDAYQSNNDILIAIEPLFDSLKLKYQLLSSSLIIWKDDEKFEYDLLPASDTNNEVSLLKSDLISDVWANDGYYIYVSSKLLEQIFNFEIEYNTSRLTFNIAMDKDKNKYQFPLLILRDLEEKRAIAKIGYNKEDDSFVEKVTVPITIEDQYRLITLPHGQVSSSIALNNTTQRNNFNVQLVSDLLYHSANINLSRSKGSDLVGGLTLSRYKSAEDKPVLGLFDNYRLGDVASVNTTSISSVSSVSGLGVNVQRAKLGYRRNNRLINIEQDAPPGYEAELYLNNTFVAQATVPDTGLLLFENVDVFYGLNNFSIRVYGPFGEEQEFLKTYNLDRNPLGAGEFAYTAYALDSDRSVFNNSQENTGFSIDSIGASIDYGINDVWQIGIGLSGQKNDNVLNNSLTNIEKEYEQNLSLKNNLSLPGVLFENEFAINNDSGYVQETSLSGNIFNNASYDISYSSGNGLLESRLSSSGEKFNSVNARFNHRIKRINYRFFASNFSNDTTSTFSLSNNLSYRFNWLNLANTLTYQKTEFKDLELEDESYTGALIIGGAFSNSFRVSANVLYDFKSDDDFISNSSSFLAQYRVYDPFGLRHFVDLRYRPIAETGSRWQLSHSVNWEADSHRLNVRSSYDDEGEWDLSLNFSFFFGYDYHNNRTKFSNSINTNSASLNAHAYLDRQYNGRPDVLDYNLEGVKFSGNRHWEGSTTGKNGRIVLPGVKVNGPFSFSAKWKDGSKTIRNDYVVYTHPGARLDVNLPFYLTSEFSGFVYRGANEVPASGIVVELVELDGTVIDSQVVDIDGYYEFTDVKPSKYQIRLNKQSLRDKSFTADVIGYQLLIPSSGGFAELPSLILRRLDNADDFSQEKVIPLVIQDENKEALIYDEDLEVMKNLFVLPTKDKVTVEPDLVKALIVVKTEEKKQKTLFNRSNKPKNQEKVFAPSTTVINKKVNTQLPVVKPVNTSVSYRDGFTLQLGAFKSKESAERLSVKYAYLTKKPTIKVFEITPYKTIYRVFLGKFLSKESALIYASEERLPKSDFMLKKIQIEDNTFKNSVSDDIETEVIETTGNVPTVITEKLIKEEPIVNDDKKTNYGEWVIQLHASQSTLGNNAFNRFKAIGPLYQAKKTIPTNNEVWHALLSKAFVTKQDAKDELKRLGVDGWVTSITTYNDIVKLNK